MGSGLLLLRLHLRNLNFVCVEVQLPCLYLEVSVICNPSPFVVVRHLLDYGLVMRLLGFLYLEFRGNTHAHRLALIVRILLISVLLFLLLHDHFLSLRKLM